MYSLRPQRVHSRRLIIAALVSLLIIFIGGIWVIRTGYSNNLKPVSTSSTLQYYTIENGETLQQIATGLNSAKLIRNAKAFEVYVRSNEFQDKLQAGTYQLSPAMSVQTIVKKLVRGDVARNLLTILPGKRLDEIKAVFIKNGYKPEEVDAAFSPAAYAGQPVLSGLPAGASLEGYLYPDSFQKDPTTPASTIVGESLDEMARQLTPDRLQAFAIQGLNLYQAVTLASIVYQETDNPAYMASVAQVFITRIRSGMPLQSNVTANYAADIAGKARDVRIASPYNTYLHPGLPPGPIGNMTVAALEAVAHPSSTDFLYFVAGDDGKVHFSHTEAEHNDAIKQYCHKICAQ